MKLSEYSDEDLIEEIRHRGIKIEIDNCEVFEVSGDKSEHSLVRNIDVPLQVKIGGVAFDIK